jgi:uncharacterized repeat protein (TIGR01451 family)
VFVHPIRSPAARRGAIVVLSAVLLAASGVTAQVTETQLTTVVGDQRPAWSPDGTTILFESNRSANLDVWSVPVTGGTAVRLTFSKGVDQQPDWSPDGTAYALSSAPVGAGFTDIYTRPIGGGAATLLHLDAAAIDALPAWSPDGLQVAYVKGTDIYVLPATGGTPVQLTTDPANDTHPTWSPDGTQIAFQSDRGGNPDVWVMPAAGGAATQLTSDPAADGSPDWSPDGTQLAFQSGRSGNNDIWIMPAAGGAATQITTAAASDVNPDWSPDGTGIVFARAGSGLWIATLAIVPQADLAVAKSVDDPTPDEGATVQFTVTVTNGGPDAASGVEVTDLLPAGVTFLSANASQGAYNQGSGLWTVGSLLGAQQASLTIDATVNAGTGGSQITNTATRTASSPADPVPANDSAAANIVPNVPGIDSAVQLTFDPGIDTMPAWSPDGTQIAWSSNRAGSFHVYLVSATGGSATQLTFGPNNDEHPDWSPDGQTIAFDSDRAGNYDIWTIPAAGGTPFQVNSNPTVDRRASWSPDGTTISFDVNAGTYELWEIPATGGTAVPITSAPSIETDADYSPDGLTMLFDSDRFGPLHVFIMPVGGGLETQLTTVTGPNFDPQWSPDGSQIAFSSGRGTSQDLWVMPSTGEPPATQITNGPGVDAILNWSPDGTKLCFVSDRAGNKDIWVIDVPGAAPAADLSVVALVSDPSPLETDTIVYTIRATNTGALAATGVEITDLLPAGVTFVSDVPSQGSYASGTGVWTVGTLAGSAAATLDITCTVDAGTAGQMITNGAAVTAMDQADPNPTNDGDSVNLTVGNGSIIVAQVGTGGVSDRSPCWSPDGSTIWFDSMRSGNRDLWSMPAAGGSPTQQTFSTKVDQYPDISPDGTQVVYAAVQTTGTDLYLRATSGGGGATGLVIDPSAPDRYPAWSPSGAMVAFEKGNDIWVVPSTGGAATQLTFDPGVDSYPCWSPDGTQIVFRSDRSGGGDLYVIPAAGGTEVQLTFDPMVDGGPDWSPDGTQIAFHSDRSGTSDIWVMPALGGVATQITSGPNSDVQPAWSPDGQKIVFARDSDLWTATFPSAAPALVSAVGRGAAPRPPVVSAGSAPVFALTVGAPNPFRDATSFRFSLPAPASTQLSVFDVTGRRVRTLLDRPLEAGQFDARWDGRDEGGRAVAPGVYFVRLQSGANEEIRKSTRID